MKYSDSFPFLQKLLYYKRNVIQCKTDYTNFFCQFSTHNQHLQICLQLKKSNQKENQSKMSAGPSCLDII